MPNLWISDGEKFVPGVPSVGTGTGYVPGNALYRRPTPNTWQLVWQRDTVPPPAPQVVAQIVAGTRNQLSITVTTPSAGTKKYLRVVVKVGINKWASGPTANDGCYYAETNGGEPWSEWFTSSLTLDNTIEAGEVATKQFPASYQNINVPLNTRVNVSAWVQDTNLNWSPAGTASVLTLKATDPPQGMQLFTTAVFASSFDTWSSLHQQWELRGTTPKDWIKNNSLPHIYGWQGGSWKEILYMCYADRVRMVANAAYSVVDMQWHFVRRGESVPQDNAFASQPPRGVVLRVYTHGKVDIPTKGSTSDLSSSYVDIKTNATYGEGEILTLPQSVWQQFLDGKGTAKGIAFYSATSTDKDAYNPYFALLGSWNNVWRGKKPGGIMYVRWYGTTNPWPEATPGHASYKPIGYTGPLPFPLS